MQKQERLKEICCKYFKRFNNCLDYEGHAECQRVSGLYSLLKENNCVAFVVKPGDWVIYRGKEWRIRGLYWMKSGLYYWLQDVDDWRMDLMMNEEDFLKKCKVRESE